jgi:nitroimidazol reductase NimA-like FMN-containing flavoprotein (pyridoxamine 5'-phosphate oxidase superfamily)
MKLVDRRTGVEVIDSAECLQLLASEEVGRLAVVTGGQPHVIPVNYVVEGDTVIFRSADGTKLRGALEGPVAFEVDRFDRAGRGGWSVVVHGRAEEITATDPSADVARAAAVVPEPWADFSKEHLVRVVPRVITGRRITMAPPDPSPS